MISFLAAACGSEKSFPPPNPSETVKPLVVTPAGAPTPQMNYILTNGPLNELTGHFRLESFKTCPLQISDLTVLGSGCDSRKIEYAFYWNTLSPDGQVTASIAWKRPTIDKIMEKAGAENDLEISVKNIRDCQRISVIFAVDEVPSENGR